MMNTRQLQKSWIRTGEHIRKLTAQTLFSIQKIARLGDRAIVYARNWQLGI